MEIRQRNISAYPSISTLYTHVVGKVTDRRSSISIYKYVRTAAGLCTTTPAVFSEQQCSGLLVAVECSARPDASAGTEAAPLRDHREASFCRLSSAGRLANCGTKRCELKIRPSVRAHHPPDCYHFGPCCLLFVAFVS
jgi:hypothetical protein